MPAKGLGRDGSAAAARGEIIHASAVAVEGRALLILGPSGAGKSALALQMIALGAVLVADDRVALSAQPDGVIAAPAPNIAGLIEARGLGLMRMPHCSGRVVAALQLDRPEPARLPPDDRNMRYCEQDVPLLFRPPGDHVAAIMFLHLQHGREA
ncbi:MAG: HPr kinase/phosphatase C-terminal domain-containing protein [Celeribacter sp.]|jgi:HPr kinase/phosphorylase